METEQGFLLSRQQKQVHADAEAFGARWYHVVFEIDFAADEAPQQRLTQLQQALTAQVAEHEILHTEFYRGEQMCEPLQQLNPDIRWQWQEEVGIDVAALKANFDVQPQGVQLCARAQVDPSGRKAALRLSFNAMVADTKTLQLMAQNLSAALGLSQASDDETVQYVDFAQWQDEVIEEDATAAQFWQQQKVQLRSYPQLVAQRSRGEVPACAERRCSVTAEGLFEESLMLSAWLLVLQRFADENRVWVDVQSDCRKVNPAFARALGRYQRMLPCRFEPLADKTAADVVAEVGEALGRYRQSQMSLPVVDTPAGDSVGFEWAETPDPGRGMSIVARRVPLTGYKLFIRCEQSVDNTLLTLHFDADVIPETMATSLLNAYRSVLVNWQGDRPLSEQSLVDRIQNAARLQGKSKPFADDDTFVVRFARSVLAGPTKPALVIAAAEGRRELNYRRLNDASDALMAAMTARGLKQGQKVALCFGHDLALGVAVVAILKAGCSYIAIDANIPSERMEMLLGNADFLLYGDAAAENPTLSGWSGSKWQLDSELQALDAYSADLEIRRVAAKDSAYVIYTSGSTGKPKGVEISHGALINYLDHAIEHYFADAEGSVVHSPVGFDLTVTALLAPLCCGKFVSLVSDEGDLAALKQALTAHQGEPLMLKLTPAHLKALNPWLAGLKPGQLNVDTLVVGGEALYPRDIEICCQRWPSMTIVNEYGPTEATVGCCIYSGECVRDQAAMPIGLPIANTHLLVLDGNGLPLPHYCPGELYIAGTSLAEGYLGEPGLSAERFSDMALFDNPAERCYRSGDKVFLAMGESGFEFLGRSDDQLKIRGYRIEPGEVVAAVKSRLSVEDAFVCAHTNPFGEAELVAYLQVAQEVTLDALRLALETVLPGYMVPSQLICVKSLPLTQNGKVDAKALPAPSFTRVRQPYVAPRNDIERHLVEAWESVLGLEAIGINDNFFALGGDSIRVVHVVSIVNEYDYGLSAETLFAHPTIAEAAEWIAEQFEHEDASMADLLEELESLSEEEVAERLALLETEAEDD